MGGLVAAGGLVAGGWDVGWVKQDDPIRYD